MKRTRSILLVLFTLLLSLEPALHNHPLSSTGADLMVSACPACQFSSAHPAPAAPVAARVAHTAIDCYPAYRAPANETGCVSTPSRAPPAANS